MSVNPRDGRATNRGSPPGKSKMLVALFVLFLMGTLALTLGFSRPASASSHLVVTGDAVNIRSGPSTGYRVIGMVYRGNMIAGSGAVSNGWYQVSYNGRSGWICGQYVTVRQDNPQPNPPAQGNKVVVKGDWVNIRSGAGTGYRILGTVSRGTVLAGSGAVSNGWYQVSYNGRSGWIYGQYVTVEQSTPPNPNPQPTPTPPPVPGGQGQPSASLYRVRQTWTDAKSQLGAFKDLNNAKILADKNPGYQVFDESGKMVYSPDAQTQPVIVKDPIMGTSQVTAGQMAAFLLANNPEPLIGMDTIQFCQLYLDEGAAEGVRGDIAFSQSLRETGYFRFTGDVKPEQHNYAGIGTAADGVAGAGFPDQRTGIRAQIQHLKAYASTESLRNPVVDPRFNLVVRGSATTWQDLAGHWSVPGYDKAKYPSLNAALAAGESYGQEIMKLYAASVK